MSTDEEKISSLYHQGNNETPPNHLDEAILKAAHGVIDNAIDDAIDDVRKSSDDKHSTAKSPFSGSWTTITSIAAVLIITVILVPLLEQEATQDMPQTTEIQNPEAIMDHLQRLDQQHEKEQDAMMRSRANTLKEEARSKAKKRPLMKMQEYQSYRSIPMEHEKNEIAEESMAPALSQMPASAPPSMATGKSKLNAFQAKPELETMSLSDDATAGFAEKKATSVPLSTKIWLEKIEQLIDQGDLDQARQELAEFKQHYPDELIKQSITDACKNP